MFENVTVIDAMAEDMEKLRPRLKNVHIRELVVAITMTPKMQKPMFTCGRKRHCVHAQPRRTCGPPHSTPRGLITSSRAPTETPPQLLRAFLHRTSPNPVLSTPILQLK